MEVGNDKNLQDHLFEWGGTLFNALMSVAMVVVWNMYQDLRANVAANTALLAERGAIISRMQERLDYESKQIVELHQVDENRARLLQEILIDVNVLKVKMGAK